MSKENFYPKLRQVDIFPTEYSGQKVVCLRDPLNLSGKILFFPYPAFFIVSLFDGQNSVVDIQEKFMRQFGELLFREKIQELANQLEEHFLLDSERFRRLEREIIEAFKTAPTRPMVLSGETYEADPDCVKKMIHSFFAPPEGPGLPVAGPRSGVILGAIAPHIDYRRGGIVMPGLTRPSRSLLLSIFSLFSARLILPWQALSFLPAKIFRPPGGR